MKKKSFWKDTVIVGLALFSTMFGAGNLIFPPQIGLFSGQEWFLGAMGLLLGGIVLPVMALWAVNNVGEGSVLSGELYTDRHGLYLTQECCYHL